MWQTALSQDTLDWIRRYTVSNALQHEGKALPNSVVGRILSEHPDLRPQAKDVVKAVREAVDEINSLSIDQLKLMESEPTTQTRAPEEERRLPPLPNGEKYSQIVTRFAPNPDGPLTFGHARAFTISHEYAVLYKGQFVLRFEDTDPRTKPPIPEAYDWIREDLRWMGADWQAEYIQSSRLEVYYSHAERLIKDSKAYVCTCKPQRFKQLVTESLECPCRSKSSKVNLGRWEKMLDGRLAEGKAVVRIKTDLSHPNPAVRDWPALRVIDTKKHPHPLVGSKYRVWPLYNFSAAIDDHEMGVTHILRAKEHVTNATKQEYLYSYMGWEYPEAVHFGMVLLPGTEIHKSFIRKEIAEGRYLGWDDPRLTTLRALKRRGILPETIRWFMLEIGAKPIEATLSWENLYAENRKLLDPVSKRYSFVAEPVTLVVENLHESFESKIPLHVEKPEWGFHKVSIIPTERSIHLVITRDDLKLFETRQVVRLMGLFNIRVISSNSTNVSAEYHSLETAEAKKEGAPIIQWVKASEGLPVEVVMPDASRRAGLGEKDCANLRLGEIVQFLRFGFVRVDQVGAEIRCFYGHK